MFVSEVFAVLRRRNSHFSRIRCQLYFVGSRRFLSLARNQYYALHLKIYETVICKIELSKSQRIYFLS